MRFLRRDFIYLPASLNLPHGWGGAEERGHEGSGEHERKRESCRTQSLAYLPRRGRGARASAVGGHGGSPPRFLEGKKEREGAGWRGGRRPGVGHLGLVGWVTGLVGHAVFGWRGVWMVDGQDGPGGDGRTGRGRTARGQRGEAEACRLRGLLGLGVVLGSAPAMHRLGRWRRGPAGARSVDHVTLALAHAVVTEQGRRGRVDGWFGSFLVRGRKRTSFFLDTSCAVRLVFSVGHHPHQGLEVKARGR